MKGVQSWRFPGLFPIMQRTVSHRQLCEYDLYELSKFQLRDRHDYTKKCFTTSGNIALYVETIYSAGYISLFQCFQTARQRVQSAPKRSCGSSGKWTCKYPFPYLYMVCLVLRWIRRWRSKGTHRRWVFSGGVCWFHTSLRWRNVTRLGCWPSTNAGHLIFWVELLRKCTWFLQ